MVRRAAQQLVTASLTGGFASGQGLASYAVPAVAAPKSSGVFGSKRVTTPLSEPLDGVNIPTYASPKAPELQVGDINGIKAATISAAGPNATVALFVGAGSANETAETAGSAKLLEYMAFKATANRTTFRLTRELEKYGAVTSASAGREHIGYCVEATKMDVPAVTEMLLDSVLNARLADWEVKDIVSHMEEDMAMAAAHPPSVVSELLHRAAFSGGLSKPLLPDPSVLSRLDADAVREYVAANFKANNVVLTGAGVDMGTLQQVAGPMLETSGSKAPGVSSSYTGGSLNMLIPGAPATVGLAYEAKGGLVDAKATAVAAVLKALLNELREPLPWMNKEAEGDLVSMIPVVSLYNKTGLVGLMATTAGGAGKALDALSSKLEALAKGPSDAALAAAKSLALGGYQSAIAAKTGVVQDMGLQLLARGKFSSSEYAAAVSALTPADVASAMGAMLKGAPTVVAAGSLTDIPKYDVAAKRFS